MITLSSGFAIATHPSEYRLIRIEGRPYRLEVWEPLPEGAEEVTDLRMVLPYGDKLPAPIPAYDERGVLDRRCWALKRWRQDQEEKAIQKAWEIARDAGEAMKTRG